MDAKESMPLWDDKRGTKKRFSIGLTTLDQLIDAGKITAKQLNPGRTSKTMIFQPSVQAHFESLPAPNPPRLRKAKA